MELDLYDVVMSMRRYTGVRLRKRVVLEEFDRWADAGKQDISVAELCELIRRIQGREPRCARCRYDLRGHPPSGICPECGSQFTDQVRWQDVATLLHEWGGCEVARVRPESLFVKDLGLE